MQRGLQLSQAADHSKSLFYNAELLRLVVSPKTFTKPLRLFDEIIPFRDNPNFG